MKSTAVLSIAGSASGASLAPEHMQGSALAQQQETAPARIGQALARWQNFVIETATLLVIGVSALITARFFGWGSSDAVVDVRAAVFAVGVDVAYYAAVTLTRVSLSGRYWSRWWAVFWMFWALFWGAFSWMNNLFFVAGFWAVQPQALARTGIPEWIVLHVAAGVPQAIVVMMAFVPRHQEQDTRSPAEKYQEKLKKLEEQAYAADIRQREAELRGKNLRAVASAYLTGKSLAERTAAEQAAQGKADQAERERKLRETQLVAWGDLLRELAEKHTDDLDMTRFVGHDEVTLRSLARWLRARGEDVPSLESMAGPALVQSAAKSMRGASAQEPSSSQAGENDNGVPETSKADALKADTMSMNELAEAMDVSRGTILYWMRTDAQEPFKIVPEEVITLEDGSKRILSAAFPRLFRAQAVKNREGRTGAEKTTKGVSRSSRGRIPAVLPPANGANHEHQNGTSDTDPLVLPKLENGEV